MMTTHYRACERLVIDGGYEAQGEHLRRRGWCVLKEALPPSLIAALAEDLLPQFENTLYSTGGFYGERTKRFGRLLLRSFHAAALVQQPEVLMLVEAQLGRWCDTIQLNLGQAIEIHPGALAQMAHRDQDMWQGPKGEIEYLVNVMWPLTSFTEANGATIIHSDSHGPAAVSESKPEPGVAVECEPGSAIVFLGSTLHGAGGNRTLAPRRGVIISYCLGWLKPYENQWLAYPPEIARTFSPALSALVGYQQHRPNLGNIEGLCPSVLLGAGLPEKIGAIDTLRPDQVALVAEHVALQREEMADPAAGRS